MPFLHKKHVPKVGIKEKQRSEAAAFFISYKGINRNDRAMRGQYKKEERKTRTKGLRWGLVVIPVTMVTILVGGLWLAYQEFMRITPVSMPVVSGYEAPPESGTSSAGKESTRDRLLTVVNLKNSVPSGFEMELTPFEGDIVCDRRVEGPLKELLAAATAAGYSLKVEYAYLDANAQQEQYESAVQELMAGGKSKVYSETQVKKRIQPGGFSDYQTGLAVRLANTDEGNFGTSEAFKWILTHCYEYGFVVRYPSDKESVTDATFDPHHLRYVGVDDAKQMRALGMCLEEYASYIKKQESTK